MKHKWLVEEKNRRKRRKKVWEKRNAEKLAYKMKRTGKRSGRRERKEKCLVEEKELKGRIKSGRSWIMTKTRVW